jgi:hypothetical protein
LPQAAPRRILVVATTTGESVPQTPDGVTYDDFLVAMIEETATRISKANSADTVKFALSLAETVAANRIEERVALEEIGVALRRIELRSHL